MDQKHTCEHCGGHIAYPSEFAGKKIQCSHCNASITLGSWDNPTLGTRPPSLDAKEENVGSEIVRSMIWNPKVLAAVVAIALVFGVSKLVSRYREAAQMKRESRVEKVTTAFPTTFGNVARQPKAKSEKAPLLSVGFPASAESVVAPSTIGQTKEDSLTQGLVAFYPFDGNANDRSGFANHAVMHGAFLTTDRFGNANSACGFDGKKSYIEIPDSKAFKSRSFTISLWFYAVTFPGNTTSTDAQFLISKGQNNFELHLGAPGRSSSGPSGLRFSPRSGSGANWDSPSSAYTLDRWHHVVAIYAVGASVSIFVDSIKVPLSGPPQNNMRSADNSSNARLGMRTDGTLAFWGKIDDIMIYKRPLSAEEVKRLFHDHAMNNSESQSTTSAAKAAVPEKEVANNLGTQRTVSIANGRLPEKDTKLISTPTNNFVELGRRKGELQAFGSSGLLLKANPDYLPRIRISDITDEEMLAVLNTKNAYLALTAFKGNGARTVDSEAIEMRLQLIWASGTSLKEKTQTRLVILETMRDYNIALERYARSSAVVSSNPRPEAPIGSNADATSQVEYAIQARQKFEPIQTWLVNKGFPLNRQLQYIPSLD